MGRRRWLLKSRVEAKRREKQIREKLKEVERESPVRTREAVEAIEERLEESKSSTPVTIEKRQGSNVQFTRPKALKYWAHNAILVLVNEGVAMPKTWSVMEAKAKALGVEIVGVSEQVAE
ncbi:hypothetical protein BDM02DRAFT_3259814 [Thelephora ganbajun]|uniref:Uncharacterized protein n=1 Tax=Thelephora ganbajun TaxID=370292 RepID=A0ACB6ZLA1_THEGA|nr:hypothetical protein BDM02DRAFT_3259814 [Thelephora ganbajun]